jgi:L-aspartate oxidase
MTIVKSDVLIIGAGIGGLTLAIKLAQADERLRITVLDKTVDGASNTQMAQGGIAAVTDFGSDSFQSHIDDTLMAGAGHCDPAVVRHVVCTAPERVHELLKWGMRFDGASGRPDLALEGGHSARRVLHHADMTGLEVSRTLMRMVASLPQIQMVRGMVSTDLIVADGRCHGVWTRDASSNNVGSYTATATVLCTGGSGQAYALTTNPQGATGDGVAMALRAGVPLADMEFVQFHPTALAVGHATGPAFLISEAVRGAGAVLVDAQGNRFMDAWHPLGSLAPRDVVARHIALLMQQCGTPHVWLDCRPIGLGAMRAHFPNISAHCLRLGIDPMQTPLPVAPAAHYQCGGVKARIDGSTALPGLFAVGECACTGLHGANRLASNSLLEALVMAHECHIAIQGEMGIGVSYSIDLGLIGLAGNTEGASSFWAELRTEAARTMSDLAGPLRSATGLDKAEDVLTELALRSATAPDGWSTERQAAENLLDVSMAIVRAARARTDSLGCHHMLG